MTPSEYLQVEREQEAIIAKAKRRIYDARILAEQSPLPKNLRRARAEDIVEGAIIWYTKKTVGLGCCRWSVVSEPMYYGDSFRAYLADDGSRYGLDGAYIEEQTDESAQNEPPKIIPLPARDFLY